ncbi:MAG: hypothetical protein QHH04_01485 [Methanolinea sp.]|nr:hypothetical protein [Methanolinea sp.]
MAAINEDTIEKLKNMALTRCMERIEKARALPKSSSVPSLPSPPGVTRPLKSRHGLL